MPRPTSPDDWTPGDVRMSLVMLVAGVLVTALTVLGVRGGLSGILVVFVGAGGFLIGPLLVLLGLNGVVRSLWSARPRSFRGVIEGESAPGSTAPRERSNPYGGADDA